ncbi:MAG: hypothetical protein IT366_16220 [Candidatus Hydrogenedentes bacterium]|nr:hypothetical protein [Candidatus Hydrogenedentota bacterium]
MENAKILGLRFQKFDEEFSQFARLSEWEKKCSADFEALVCEAGRLAWNCAHEGLLASDLQERVIDAKKCWEDIQARRKPELDQFIYERVWEPAGSKSDMYPIVGPYEITHLNEPETKQEVGKKVRKNSKRTHMRLVSVRTFFYDDFERMAHYRFWRNITVPFLQSNYGGIAPVGLRIDQCGRSKFQWPESIVVPIDPHHVGDKRLGVFRLQFITERAKSYSDASRALASILLTSSEESDLNRVLPALQKPSPAQEMTQAEIIKHLYDADFANCGIALTQFDGQFKRAVRSHKIESRKVGDNLYVSLSSAIVWIQAKKEKLNAKDRERFG